MSRRSCSILGCCVVCWSSTSPTNTLPEEPNHTNKPSLHHQHHVVSRQLALCYEGCLHFSGMRYLLATREVLTWVLVQRTVRVG